MRPLRVLVVDDSALNRNELVVALSSLPDTEVVGCATDGVHGLEVVRSLAPGLIVLDLEMPRMDGFTFLKLIPSVWRCPIIVFSSKAGSRDVLKALELGAVDFIVKPARSADRLTVLQAALGEKIRVVRALRQPRQHADAHRCSAPDSSSTGDRAPPSHDGALPAVGPRTRSGSVPVAKDPVSRRWPEAARPNRLLAIAASTGGPRAIGAVLGQLRPGPYAVVIAQHLPSEFTRAFAQQLDANCSLDVSEAESGALLRPGAAVVAPGRKCLEVVAQGTGLVLSVSPARPEDRYVPSADRLLASSAAAMGPDVLGLILTGMGDDGVKGAQEVARCGGFIVAESEATAVVYGMPRAVIARGLANRALPLPEIPDLLNVRLSSAPRRA